MIYSAKIVQASGMTKQNTQFLFFIPERRLSYEKIVQMSEKASSSLECFSECSLSFEKRYKGEKQEKIMSIDYVICNFVICNFCNL